MIDEYRALTESVVRSMQRRWPVAKEFRKELGIAFKNQYYTNMRRGGAVPASLIVEVVRGILRLSINSTKRKSARDAIEELLKQGQAAIPTPLTDEIILDRMTQKRLLASAISKRTDPLQWGFHGVVQFFRRHFAKHVLRKLKGCPLEDVPTAVHWLYIAAGRLVTDTANLPFDRAIENAEKFMQLPEKEYSHRALRWREEHPWSIMLVKTPSGPSGPTVVLPLAHHTYEALLAGQLATYDCAGEQLVSPTNYLLIEAVAERPSKIMGGPASGAEGLYYALLAQVAALTRVYQMPPGTPIHLLSFSASPLGRKRLTEWGFKPTAKRMRNTGVEFMVRTLGEDFVDKVPYAFIHLLSHELPHEPPS